MDIQQVLAELRQELERINEAIASLERLQRGVPRRGRPPRWLTLVAKSGALAANQRGIEPEEDEF